jgi:hypothetical protein
MTISPGKIDLTFLANKSDAFDAIKHYIAKVERQLDCKVGTIRSDNGREFESSAWLQYMRERGIIQTRVPPGAHAQNGRVE